MSRLRIPQSISVNRSLLVLTATATLLLPGVASAQAKRYPLESVDRLRLHNVTAEPAILQGKKGLRITISEETLRRMERMRVYAQGLALIEDLDFSSGVIEAEIAGALAPGAGREARGFVGIAFRVQEDLETYDAFYLRPTNGRADDQERRNHSAQYISHPEWPWSRLRKERRASTKRTSTLCREHGRRSKSRCAVNRRASTSTTRNSRR
jgi:hypothetical protein